MRTQTRFSPDKSFEMNLDWPSMVDALSGWMAQPRFNWLKNCCLCVCEVVLNSSNPLCETVTVKYFDKNVLITNDT